MAVTAADTTHDESPAPTKIAVATAADSPTSPDTKPGAGDGVVASPAGPELGMSTAVGEEGRRAAARQTLHGADSALLEDISFVQRDLENPGKLQVCVCVCCAAW